MAGIVHDIVAVVAVTLATETATGVLGGTRVNRKFGNHWTNHRSL